MNKDQKKNKASSPTTARSSNGKKVVSGKVIRNETRKVAASNFFLAASTSVALVRAAALPNMKPSIVQFGTVGDNSKGFLDNMERSMELHYIAPFECDGKLYVKPNLVLIAKEISK